MRYIARQGVVDWMVWDREKRCPAYLSGRQLLKLSKDQAMCLQAELNGVEPPVTTPKIEMTANEIALLIRSESDLAMPWPRGAEVTVHGAGERRWTAKCYSPDPVRDAQFSWKIRQIADKLRQRFDLKLH